MYKLSKYLGAIGGTIPLGIGSIFLIGGLLNFNSGKFFFLGSFVALIGSIIGSLGVTGIVGALNSTKHRGLSLTIQVSIATVIFFISLGFLILLPVLSFLFFISAFLLFLGGVILPDTGYNNN